MIVLRNLYLVIRVYIIIQTTVSVLRSFNPSKIISFDNLSIITKIFIHLLLLGRSVIKSIDISYYI